MEPMLIVFICSQFVWIFVVLIILALYLRALKSCYAMNFGKSPLGHVLKEMVYYCNKVWPTYVLGCGEVWPRNGSVNYATIMQLHLFCQRSGRWDEITYLKVFVSLCAKVSTGKGNRLLEKSEEAASKPLPDDKTKESLSGSENPWDTRLVAGRSPAQSLVKRAWWLCPTFAGLEQQEMEMAGEAYHHDSSCQKLLSQPKEIKGGQDPSILHKRLKASNDDVPPAVSSLTKGMKKPGQETVATEPPAVKRNAINRKALAKAIGLISASKDDFQVLSLLKSPKAQASGRNLNRTQEAISADMKCEGWGQNPNRKNWRRVDGWPVGLKNVGNTCWFNAVIQSLFQLPELRRLVLGYSLPQSVLESHASHTEKRNVMFMQQLQYLFALMIGSNRKFVDPSAALNLLKGAFQSTEEQQQDVSEFTHKLLEWLEDAFQLAVNANSPRSKSENPMVRLFYGTFLTEGVREGKPFCYSETFSLYPLQVNSYCNLDECLEGAMIEGDIELLPSGQSVMYGQECWFTKLPPVLTFELSRFKFNQSLSQPEKIHDKVEFPEIFYMDRYMHRNKDLVRSKRDCIRKLKEEVKVLQQKLETCMKCLDPAQFPLLEVTSPSDTSVTLPLASVVGQESSSQVIESVLPEDCLPKSTTMEKPLPSSWSPAEMPAHPASPTVTDEVNLKTCLQRRRSEIGQEIQDLKNRIATTTETIKQMYCDPLLNQVPYRLHAVLVHEGQASAGHYWAYVYNQPQRVWLKYNDIFVTQSSWEELKSDSYGGLKKASAYCLMYVDDKLPHFNAGAAAGESAQVLGELEALPAELKHYVQKDNWRFEQEVEK